VLAKVSATEKQLATGTVTATKWASVSWKVLVKEIPSA
jgi:hypothetical protein